MTQPEAGVGAGTLLSGRQDMVFGDDAVFLAESSLPEIGPVDVAHLHHVGQVEVLGLHPGHQALSVLVAEQAKMDVIVPRKPSQLPHVDPALRPVGPFQAFSRLQGDGVEQGKVLQPSTNGDLPFSGRQGHVEGAGDAPVVAAQPSRQIGGDLAAAVAVELLHQVQGIAGPIVPAVRLPDQPDHGRRFQAGVVRKHPNLQPGRSGCLDLQWKPNRLPRFPLQLDHQRGPLAGNAAQTQQDPGGGLGGRLDSDGLDRLQTREGIVLQEEARLLPAGHHLKQECPHAAGQLDRFPRSGLGKPLPQVEPDQAGAGIQEMDRAKPAGQEGRWARSEGAAAVVPRPGLARSRSAASVNRYSR